MRILLSVLLVLLLVPSWSGEARLDLPQLPARLWITPVPLDTRSPAHRRVGRLSYLGGWHLTGSDPAFGGYSALAVVGERFTLLGDGGNWLRFRFHDGHVSAATAGALPAGPGTGWSKLDRDSESFALDPAGGKAWVGFEGGNMIGRYTAALDRAETLRVPPEMRGWPQNGGAESLARLPDGRFVVLAELARGDHGRGQTGLMFAGDPTQPITPFYFTYLSPPGYVPSDATALPDGRLIVLNRRFELPFSFPVIVTEIAAGAIRPNALVPAAEVARLEPPLVSDNFEGIAATREGKDTILWIVSDDNQEHLLERTLLLKFRLEPPTTKARALQ